MSLVRGVVGIWAVLVGSVGAWAQTLPKSEIAPNVTLEITELRRMTDKDAMQLRFAVLNGSSAVTSPSKLGFGLTNRLDGIVLLDFANKRSYTIGSASRCLCSLFDDGGEIKPGARREFWAWFGLPPAGVQALSIQIGDQPPIQDVPLR